MPASAGSRSRPRFCARKSSSVSAGWPPAVSSTRTSRSPESMACSWKKNGMLRMGTFHPAALLRNPGQKPLAFADFLALREKNRGGLHPYRAGLPGGMISLFWNDAGPFSDRFLRPPPYEDGAGFLRASIPGRIAHPHADRPRKSTPCRSRRQPVLRFLPRFPG